jgi:hypothetical protein
MGKEVRTQQQWSAKMSGQPSSTMHSVTEHRCHLEYSGTDSTGSASHGISSLSFRVADKQHRRSTSERVLFAPTLRNLGRDWGEGPRVPCCRAAVLPCAVPTTPARLTTQTYDTEQGSTRFISEHFSPLLAHGWLAAGLAAGLAVGHACSDRPGPARSLGELVGLSECAECELCANRLSVVNVC